MNAIKAPIPALTARLKSLGMLRMTQLLNLVKDKITKIAPESATMPKALCQGSFSP